MADYSYKTAPGAPDNSLLDDLVVAATELRDVQERRSELNSYLQARQHHSTYVYKDKLGVFHNIMTASQAELEGWLPLVELGGYSDPLRDDCRREGSSYPSDSERVAVIKRRLRQLKKESK